MREEGSLFIKYIPLSVLYGTIEGMRSEPFLFGTWV